MIWAILDATAFSCTLSYFSAFYSHTLRVGKKYIIHFYNRRTLRRTHEAVEWVEHETRATFLRQLVLLALDKEK